MNPIQLRERIQQLREAAASYRESAARAERYHVEYQERQQAARMDREANELEALLNASPSR